ncbi:glycosyltransferase [Terrimicrobium sacchariphilum]|nr:glycosyltransferase [Terrimicrobium sacchariphilum]
MVSLIIPVYQDVDGLRCTLASLAAQDLPKERLEILVANDGGAEEISAVCRMFPVKEILVVPNQGAYVARNRALAESRGEYIGFTDADVTVDSAWCKEAVLTLQGADMASGKTKIEVSSRRTIAELYQACYAFWAESYQQNQKVAQTVNLFVRRSVFEKCGWFDGRLRSGGDIEFTLRASEIHGCSLLYNPKMLCTHPARNAHQLFHSLKRIFYGQLTLFSMYPQHARIFSPNIALAWKLIIPPKPLPATRTREFGFSAVEKLKTWLFVWLVKLAVFKCYCTIYLPYRLTRRKGARP